MTFLLFPLKEQDQEPPTVVLNDTEWPLQTESTTPLPNSNLRQQFMHTGCPFKGQLRKTLNFIQKF